MATAEPLPRATRARTSGALGHRPFRILWAADWLLYTARWLELISLSFLVLKMTDSPFAVGLVGFFRMIPLAVLGPFTGALSDRVNRKRMLLVVQSGQFTVMALLAAAIVTDVESLGLVSAAAVLMGIGWAGDYSSRRALTRDIVGHRDITNAMSLDAVSNLSGKVIGPAMAGGLIALVGVGAPFLGVASSYAVAIVLLSLVRSGSRSPAAPAGNVLRDIAEGFAYIRRNRVVLGTLAVTLIAATTMFPYAQFVPLLGRDVLEVGPTLIGILAASDGAGAVVALIVISALGSPRYPGRIYVIGTFISSLLLVLFALSVWYPVSLALLVVFGFGLGGYSAMQFALILVATPKEMGGRVIGAMLVAMGAWPLGSLMMGALAELMGIQGAIAVSAGTAALLLLLVLFFVPEMRRREISAPPAVSVSPAGRTRRDEPAGTRR